MALARARGHGHFLFLPLLVSLELVFIRVLVFTICLFIPLRRYLCGGHIHQGVSIVALPA